LIGSDGIRPLIVAAVAAAVAAVDVLAVDVVLADVVAVGAEFDAAEAFIAAAIRLAPDEGGGTETLPEAGAVPGALAAGLADDGAGDDNTGAAACVRGAAGVEKSGTAADGIAIPGGCGGAGVLDRAETTWAGRGGWLPAAGLPAGGAAPAVGVDSRYSLID
jgi:hypothetical protein